MGAFKLSQMKNSMNRLVLIIPLLFDENESFGFDYPVRDNISVEKQIKSNGACRQVRNICQTHFVPDGTFLAEASIFYQYYVPNGTRDNLNRRWGIANYTS